MKKAILRLVYVILGLFVVFNAVNGFFVYINRSKTLLVLKNDAVLGLQSQYRPVGQIPQSYSVGHTGSVIIPTGFNSSQAIIYSAIQIFGESGVSLEDYTYTGASIQLLDYSDTLKVIEKIQSKKSEGAYNYYLPNFSFISDDKKIAILKRFISQGAIPIAFNSYNSTDPGIALIGYHSNGFEIIRQSGGSQFIYVKDTWTAEQLLYFWSDEWKTIILFKGFNPRDCYDEAISYYCS